LRAKEEEERLRREALADQVRRERDIQNRAERERLQSIVDEEN
jgi:hypothetical protein